MVANRLSDEGNRSNNEVKSPPHRYKSHSEEAVAGILITELGKFSNTEVEGSQHGHDQDPEEAATEFAATMRGATLLNYQVEAFSSIANRHDKGSENTIPEIPRPWRDSP